MSSGGVISPAASSRVSVPALARASSSLAAPGRGAGGVVAAEADAEEPDGAAIDIGPGGQVVDGGGGDLLVGRLDREVVGGLALAGAVDRERGHPPGQQVLGRGLQLLLG